MSGTPRPSVREIFASITPHFVSPSLAVWQMSIAFAKSNAFVVFELRFWSQSRIVSSTTPLQSSSRLLPGASNAPPFTSSGLVHSVESQQSGGDTPGTPHVVKPSWSRSASSSAMPLQLLSMPSVQFSATGSTWPSHWPHTPAAPHVRWPAAHGPTPFVSSGPE